ncbi:MAG TPA: stage II sporulation protein M [Vicinamibacterales bacterium]|nr:stage II sporulation protein M [Vicinamibacterales bacterium]
MPARPISTRWIEKRKPHWSRLESLVAACGRRSVASLNHAEVRELALLYRQTAADLSTAREDPGSAALTRYLNELLGRSHNLVYAGAARSRPASVVRFFVDGFPQIFRETLPYSLAAFALFLAGAAAGIVLAATDPGFERFVLNGQMMDTIERREMWTHGIVSVKPYASSAIMTNNIAVSLAACATGMLAGLGPAYMMLFNGLLIGVVGSACHRAGMSVDLWSFVTPHGVLELPAIFIAGGAGLLLAKGILFPGTLPRRDSIADAGRDAIRLLLGVLPLLVIAGVIEGFVSPTATPPAAKFAIGASLFVLFAFYLARGWRDLKSDSVPSR